LVSPEKGFNILAGPGKYKIKTVAALTGLQPGLLRAWEKRYGFLEPARIDSRHRLYSEEDVEVLSSIRKLLDEGRSIGEVAALGRGVLLHMSGPRPPDRLSTPPRDVELAVLALAPLPVSHESGRRWAGEGLSVSIQQLSASDRAVLVRLYELVHGFYALWLYMREHPALDVLVTRLEPLRQEAFLSQIQRLGVSVPDPLPNLARQALRDARQGALPALIELAAQPELDYEPLQRCALLARDHAKMMRNALDDLDPELREADSSPKAHSFGAVLAKIEQIFQIPTRTLVSGAISSRCLETSALDRVLYDMIQRGQRPTLLCAIAAGPHWVRIAAATADPGPGYEVTDVATLAVSQAMKVSPELALEQKYLGSQPGWRWFHWPQYKPPPGTAICDCHP
jgi:hypothetical protein